MLFQTITLNYSNTGSELATGFADLNGDGAKEFIFSGPLYPFQDASFPFRAVGFTNNSIQLASYDTQLSTLTATHARELVIGDFNSDGIDDVFSANTGYDSVPFPGETNTLILSDGNGGFIDRSGSLPQLQSFTHSVASGDVDGDGDLDIFVGILGTLGSSSTGSYILRNDGQGNFTQDTASVPSDVRSGTQDRNFTTSFLVDINNDQNLDLILGSEQNGSTAGYTYLNNGSGVFSPASFSLLPTGYFGSNNTITSDIASIDLNGDGHQDLLVASTGGNPFYKGSALQYFENDGLGSFSDRTATNLHIRQVSAEEAVSNTNTGWVQKLWVTDVNSDGFDDFVLSTDQGTIGAQPIVAINDGGGNLHEYSGPDLEGFNYGVAPIDINSDGQMDFISNIGMYQNFNSSTPTDRSISLHTSIGNNSIWDDWYYHSVYSDVASAGISTQEHYQSTGWLEGRNPNALFNTNQYLNNNPDVAAAGIEPMTHFLEFGFSEGRDEGSLLDVYRYAADHADVAAAGINPLLHYLTAGAAEGRAAYDDLGNAF